MRFTEEEKRRGVYGVKRRAESRRRSCSLSILSASTRACPQKGFQQNRLQSTGDHNREISDAGQAYMCDTVCMYYAVCAGRSNLQENQVAGFPSSLRAPAPVPGTTKGRSQRASERISERERERESARERESVRESAREREKERERESDASRQDAPCRVPRMRSRQTTQRSLFV